MEPPAQEKFPLSVQALRRLELLQSVTNSPPTALIELGLALLVRQLLGVDALLKGSEGSVQDVQSALRSYPPEADLLPSKKSAGESLRERRESLKLTRVALAALCGVSEGTIRRYESDRFQVALISRKLIDQLAKGLQLPSTEIAKILGAVQFL